MLVFGLNVLKEIDGQKVRKAYCSRQDLIPLLQAKKIKYEMHDKKVLDKMVKGLHQGIVLDVFDYEYYDLKDVTGNFVVILDHLEDPHNFGAIIRTCVAAGINEIIIPKDRSILVNPTVVKVSVGTITKVKIVLVNNLVNAIKKLQQDGYFVYASSMDGKDYHTVDYAPKKVLVIGNEGKGISRLVKENCDEIIKIPMSRDAESLNASVAAGILIYGMRD